MYIYPVKKRAFKANSPSIRLKNHLKGRSKNCGFQVDFIAYREEYAATGVKT